MKRLLVAFGLLVAIGVGYVFVTDTEVPVLNENSGVSEIDADAGSTLPAPSSSLGAYEPADATEREEMMLLAQADLTGRNVHPALKIKDTDRVLGDVNAPVTLVEYASMTCPHCAKFHNDILPALQEQYIDTGKLNVVMRHLPWDNFALGMAAITRCAPAEFYHPLVKALFRQQEDLMKSADPLQSITQIAAMAGMSADEVAACVRDEEVQQSILAEKEEAMTVLNVRGTPTVFVNGERMQSVRNLRQVQEAIELALEQVRQSS